MASFKLLPLNKQEPLTEYLKAAFPIIRREPIPNPYAGERCVYQEGICMREACGQPRWQDPEKGDSVLCRRHTEEVYRGEAKAPPLRRGIDYQAVGRKTFLVFDLPDDT